MSTPPVITLTTDFGETAPYVAAVKGVILSINPAARVLDLSHRIRPQDVGHANYFVGTATPFFPPGTIHVCVVDPGVGSDRKQVLVEAGGRFFVGPDNGVFTKAVHALGGATCVRTLTERRFWRPEVSTTFHGRDVFAPVAAHLSLGTGPAEFGPELTEWVEFKARSAVCWHNRCEGEVQFVDDFGNLITNIPTGHVKSLPIRVAVGGGEAHPIRWVRAYADAAPGEMVSLFSSDGFFEIAVVNGSAAARLGVREGVVVEIDFE